MNILRSQTFRWMPAALGLLFLWAAPAAAQSNPTQAENALTGSPNWQLANPATGREIEGYASLTSVNQGGQISFFVSTGDSNYTLEIFRIGWYGGAGARQVLAPVTLAGIRQPTPSPDPGTGMIECRWTNPYTLTVPTNWTSGVYLARLTGLTSNKQSYIHFVVRQDSSPSAYLYQSSVTTYQAYNNWPGSLYGGKSLYGWNSNGGAAAKVSFNRPYALGANPASAPGVGAGDFVTTVQQGSETWPAGWEINMVRFLEREGYDVTYCTSIDVHENPSLLLSHKAFLSVGHDEYWSWAMRANVEAARDRGVGLGFFASNVCYWQVRFEPSPLTGAADRTMVGYKDGYTSDPYYTDGDPTNDQYITRRWRENPVKPSEQVLLGVEYIQDPVDGDIVLATSNHWALAGTGASAGQKLAGLMGYEVDGMLGANSPLSTTIIGHSPFSPRMPDGNKYPYSDMVSYAAPSGATVFATGSMQWSWGLDDYNATSLRPSRLSTVAQQITRNVLAHFLQPDTTTASTGRVNCGGPAYIDPQGVLWLGDTGFSGGSTFSTGNAISGTNTPALYQTERYGVMQYQFSIPNGTYTVNLKFAEIYFSSPGQRVFTVSINGQQVLTNFDIVAAAGGAFKAFDRPFTISVTNGSLTIQFAKVVDNPKISAIEILPQTAAATSPASVSVSPTSASLGAGQSQTFTAAVSNTANTAVTWSINPQVGTISTAGVYLAPASTTATQNVTVTATSVADPTKSGSATVTLTPLTPATGGTAIRVNAGGPAYTDSSGNVWSADTGFSGGNTYGTSSSISGTTAPTLYQTERWASGTLQYQFTVANGTYIVNLKFAEIYFTATGQRVINASINGQQVLSGFDIVAQAGGAFKAIDKSFTVTTTNNLITIALTATVNNPKISAIEILPAPAATPLVRVNAGGPAYTDGTGTVWSADTGFSAGNTYSTTNTITGTTTPVLYQTERWNNATFQYTFTVPNGTRAVTLKFAEIYNNAAGQRVFNVLLNGQQVLTNFDVFAAAGGAFRAVDQQFSISVTGGQITIQFVPVVSNPKISAIAID